MILAIPKIELSQGKCLQKIACIDKSRDIYEYFAHNPDEYIKLLRRENFKSVLIKDCDSFEHNRSNFDIIKYICQNTDVPIQLECNPESNTELHSYQEIGVKRFILDCDLSEKLESIHSNRSIIQSIFLKTDISKIISNEINNLSVLNQRLFVSNNTSIDLELMLNTIKDFASRNKVKITLYDCVSNTPELLLLNQFIRDGIDSVVLGRILYSNAFPCQRMWREIEQEIETIP